MFHRWPDEIDQQFALADAAILNHLNHFAAGVTIAGQQGRQVSFSSGGGIEGRLAHYITPIRPTRVRPHEAG